MKKSKLILVLIISILLIAIIIGILLLNLNNKTQQTRNETNSTSMSQVEIDQQENENYNNIPPDYTEEVGLQEFFTVDNCISKYLSYLNISTIDEETTSRAQLEEKIRAILSSKNTNIQFLQENNIFIPVKIQKSNSSRVVSYKVYGIIANNELEYKNDTYFVVNLDTSNKTYSIEPLGSSYASIDEIQVTNIEEIQENSYNNFTYQELTDEYKYKQLFNQMKRLMLAKPEIAYDYLEENYKSKRFENYEYFKNFIDNNRDRLVDVFPQKYKVDDDPNDILLIDQYGNWYEFIVTGTMKYTAKIDNNIVLLSRDIQKYKTYTEEEKIKFNISRWIEMLNTRDYKFAYKYLDETFKEENYKTQEDFEQYMSSKYPSRYNVSVSNIEKDGNVYSAEVELNIPDEDFSDKYMTVIMRLDEGTNFTMSFSEE